MSYQISYWCFSHIGNARRINQDNFLCAGSFMEIGDSSFQFPLTGKISVYRRPLFGIFDGMGGAQCGEVASYLAASLAASWKLRSDSVSSLRRFCREANTHICRWSREQEIGSMGTTAALLAFTPKAITLCNLGDSRVFRFSDGLLKQISRDHVGLSAFGVKPPLLQYLGIAETELLLDPYFAQGTYRAGDLYLICSDGLTDMVSSEQIAKLLNDTLPGEAAEQLLENALARGGRDNISILLLQVVET